MTCKPIPLLALALLACAPSNAETDSLSEETSEQPTSDDTGGDETGGDETDGGETDGDGHEGPPLYLLVRGQGSAQVVDVSTPGHAEWTHIIPSSETEHEVQFVGSPSSRWLVIDRSAAGNASASVWLHDFVEAPLGPAVEIPIGPSAGAAKVWMAEDESALAIYVTTTDDDHRLLYVPLDERGAGPSVEFPDLPKSPIDGGFADGSHFVIRVFSTGELHLAAIVDGQPQPPALLPGFDDFHDNGNWQASGDSLFYDSLGTASYLYRVKLSAWPELEPETLGPYYYPNAKWSLAKNGSRLILGAGPYQVAEVGDVVSPAEPLPEATLFLALSDDGRFGLFRGAEHEGSDEFTDLLGFDFESATPLVPRLLGTTAAGFDNLALESGWAVWTTGLCGAAGVNLSDGFGDVVTLIDHHPDISLRGFGIAEGTQRFYWQGTIESDQAESPTYGIGFAELTDELSDPVSLHPLGDNETISTVMASPIDERHFYVVRNNASNQLALWEYDAVSGARTQLGDMAHHDLWSLWDPGSSTSYLVGLRMAYSCIF